MMLPSLSRASAVIAECWVRGSHLNPASTDKIKKDRSSTIPRRPDPSFRSSTIQSSTPMRRMKLVDSPSTNPKTVERIFGQKDTSLTSHTRIAKNSSAKKGNLTESASVKDIYTTPQAVSAPVVPRDILEDKTVSSVCRGTEGTTTAPDAFRVPIHRRKPSLSGTAADSDSSIGSTPSEPDVCSEGLPSLKFSGLSPYYKKEEYGEVDKEDIAQIAEKMDRTVSLEHPLLSNDDKCIALHLCS